MKKLFLIIILLFPTVACADDKSQIENILTQAANAKRGDSFSDVKQFTPNLAADIDKQFTASAIKDCGPNYKTADGVCGYEFDPAVCGQDFEKPRIAKMDKTGDAYIVSVYWINTDTGTPGAIYRLVQNNGKFVIDGISCRFDDNQTIKFNWK